MKRTGLLVFSVIVTISLLAGCGSRNVDTKKDTAQITTTTQQTQKDTTSQDNKNENDNSTTQTSSTNTESSGSNLKEAAPGTTPTLDKSLKEEKTVNRTANGGITTEFAKLHPTDTLLVYINDCGKYDINKNWPTIDPAIDNNITKISDTVIIYHVPVVDSKNNVLEKRDMRVEFKDGAWSVISDVVVK
ncbi:hypothetical protein [Candidatus Clostridium radicumherbarum]|uniref:Lipoprotein n=1 Tax=Candidatus Clostridium radicumherbarum TaxID=3381662 RepID=A0ABW8TX78_9CLOT